MNAFNAVMRIVTTGLLMALAGYASSQKAYPNKPIRFINPKPPGGGTTIVARLIGQKLTESWGQQVIVDNRPGGNSIIGTEALVKSPPDGYTILMTTGIHIIVGLLNPTPLPYDTIKDFAPVATLASYELMLVLHPSVPANNLQDLIALAKSKPGQLNYATAGSGSTGHLATELLGILAGVKMQHIPYKGSGPALNDTIGGQVQLIVTSPPSAIQHIKNGLLKAIAISGETRLPALPQVPTFTEAGLPGFEVKGWYGVLAPAVTPKLIIDKLATEIAKILVMSDIKEKIVGLGMDPFISTPDQLAALMKADMAKWVNVIKTANIKVEN